MSNKPTPIPEEAIMIMDLWEENLNLKSKMKRFKKYRKIAISLAKYSDPKLSWIEEYKEAITKLDKMEL